MVPAIIFADGSYDDSAGAAGWGAVIRWKNLRWEVGGPVPGASSRQAELHAIVKSLYAIPDGHPAVVFSDAMDIVIENRKRLATKNVHLIWKKTKGDPDHTRADRLAKHHMRKMREANGSPPR